MSPELLDSVCRILVLRCFELLRLAFGAEGALPFRVYFSGNIGNVSPITPRTPCMVLYARWSPDRFGIVGLHPAFSQMRIEARRTRKNKGLGFRGYIGIVEKNVEMTSVYRGYIRIMEKKTETTI